MIYRDIVHVEMMPADVRFDQAGNQAADAPADSQTLTHGGR
jgi:hypothetical protein